MPSGISIHGDANPIAAAETATRTAWAARPQGRTVAAVIVMMVRRMLVVSAP